MKLKVRFFRHRRSINPMSFWECAPPVVGLARPLTPCKIRATISEHDGCHPQ